jgi:hypothetical protein
VTVTVTTACEHLTGTQRFPVAVHVDLAIDRDLIAAAAVLEGS